MAFRGGVLHFHDNLPGPGDDPSDFTDTLELARGERVPSFGLECKT